SAAGRNPGQRFWLVSAARRPVDLRLIATGCATTGLHKGSILRCQTRRQRPGGERAATPTPSERTFAQSSIAFRRSCNLGINHLVIEAVDALDDLRVDSWRESRFGTDLDKARPSKHLCRRGVVMRHAAVDRPAALEG